jgi:hypothetical protein
MGILKKNDKFKGIEVDSYTRITSISLDIDSLTGEIQLGKYGSEDARKEDPRGNAEFSSQSIKVTKDKMKEILAILYPEVKIEGGEEC